jgi:hypothetical protein
MDYKELEKLYDYLPVIVTTCDRYGWCGGRGAPVPKEAIPEVREFFEYLNGHIPIDEVPELEEVTGDVNGAIMLLWDAPVDPVTVTYDSFYVSFNGEGIVNFGSELESLDTKTEGMAPLKPELCSDIIEHLRFFQRKHDEQREIQKSTTS